MEQNLQVLRKNHCGNCSGPNEAAREHTGIAHALHLCDERGEETRKKRPTR